MVVVRCTKKLLDRIGSPAREVGPSTTRLGDWYANVIGVGPQRLVLLVSERGRLPVLLRARDVKNLGSQLPAAVGAVLGGLGVKPSSMTQELAEMRPAMIGRTASRSVLGSVNDFAKTVRWRLYDEPHADLVTVSLWLAKTPILVLDGQPPELLVPALLA